MRNLVSLHRYRPRHLLASRDRDEKPPKPTRAKPLIISASELRAWLRCRVQHHWRYQERLIPREGKEALGIGIVGHEILERWYGLPVAKRTVKAMTRIASERLQETIPHDLDIKALELVKAMCIGYASWALPQDREIGLTECEPEKWFEEPLTPERTILVRGKIDNVFQPGEYRWTVANFEYKFKAQIKVDVVELNQQISVYLWALRRLFPKMKRYQTYYNVLRKQLPGPRVRADLFARECVERNDDEIEQWALDATRAVLDMHGAAIYPNPMDSCQWDCDFKMPCLLRGRPGDLKHVLRTEFTKKEDS